MMIGAKRKWISMLTVVYLLVGICAAVPGTAEAASVVQKGSRGTDVYNVQYDLNFLGFSVGTVDGVAGNNTVAGIKNYQRSRQLAVDGMAGPATQQSLKSEVKAIQTKLKVMGYYRDSLDGVAGPNTIAGLKAFQKQEGLRQTGVADSATMDRLNQAGKQTEIAYSAISAPNTTVGSGVHINGTISTTGSNLAVIQAWVTNKYGQTSLSKNVNVNANSYSLYNSSIDSALTFGKLPAGSYTLHYKATAADGNSKEYTVGFTVSESNTASDNNTAVDQVIAIASGEVGKPISTYWQWYNGSKQNNSGCALFVSYVAREAGVSQEVIPTSALVQSKYYINKGLYHASRSRGGSYIPKKGDLIFYDWGARDGYYYHVEYVSKVSGNKVYTIGTSDSAGEVVARQPLRLDSEKIMGYADVQY